MHTFLALDMSTIPQSTKDNVTTFLGARFSNDGVRNEHGNGWDKEPTRMILDGYNEKGDLSHPDEVLKKWLLGLTDEQAEAKINELVLTAIEYTKEELMAEKSDSNSIWFVDMRGDH